MLGNASPADASLAGAAHTMKRTIITVCRFIPFPQIDSGVSPSRRSSYSPDGCMAHAVKNVPLLVEQFGDAASEEDASHQLRSSCHGLEFPSSHVFQFVFVLGLMTRQLLVL